MSEVHAYQVKTGVNYLCNPQHRDSNPNKAQWIINRNEEFETFLLTHNKDWIAQDEGWGYYLAEGKVQYCGHAKQDKSRLLIVAKFVVDRNVDENWHGYPADPAGRTGEAKRLSGNAGSP